MRRVIVSAAAITAMAIAPAAAHGQTAATSPSVTAIASAQVRVTPRDTKAERSITRAVEQAEAKLPPLAMAAVGARAAELASLSNLTLGRLVSISDVPPSPYGIYGPYGTTQTQKPFNDGRNWCIVRQRARYRTQRIQRPDGSVEIRRIRIGTRRVRTCAYPRVLVMQLQASYEATPQT